MIAIDDLAVRASSAIDRLVDRDQTSREVLLLAVAWVECQQRWGPEHGATLGCLRDLVRLACDPHMTIELIVMPDGRARLNVYHPGMHLTRTISGDSVAEALVACLEAAPC